LKDVPRYTADSKDRVRDAVDFVELVGARTELRRAGPARYEGRCPFHEERTPSFGIDPQQKVYYCFGCNASGDVFTFVQETEGVDFKGALELLAQRYGVELEPEAEDPKAQERRMRRERLLELLDRTSAYYERYLWESREGARAREYLQERGLGEAILREFRVGYAPSAWNSVLLASRAARYSNREIFDAGLAQRSRGSGQLYDRFRSRITFPLADVRGRVLGFGARSLSDERDPQGASAPPQSSAGSGRPPKYLNTADGEIYHKGLHLYGAHLARAHATRAGRVILCEGYTDVIALHQAGIRNAVGLMGTALTAEQVAELARMAGIVLLALDADSAGQDAMLRASALAAKRKLELRVVALPPGQDPADLIAAGGAEAMTAAIDASVPFVRFRVERALAGGDATSPEGRDRIVDELVPVFATLAPSAMRMELTRLVSERLSLPETLAEQLLGGERRSEIGQHIGRPGGGRARVGRRGRFESTGGGDGRARQPRVNGSAAEDAGARARGTESERAFLALCIALPGAGATALAELDVDSVFASDAMRRAAAHLRANLSEPAAHLPEGDHELAALMAELVVEARRDVARPEMLTVQRLQLELARIDREILGARGVADRSVSELAERRARLKHEFDRATTLALEHAGELER
jgi:DNA primase